MRPALRRKRGRRKANRHRHRPLATYSYQPLLSDVLYLLIAFMQAERGPMDAALDTTQFNTRLERSLKQAGDAVLKRAGYTPSQAVRALWRKAAGCAENPQAIVDLLEDAPASARPRTAEDDAARLEALRRGREEAARALAAMGFESDALPYFALDPYDELMEEFALERHAERVRP